MGLFEFGFMVRAFVVGILFAVIIPCIGVTVVFKRLSMIGDALSHASLAGVAGGLLLGVNPVVGALVTCVIAALGIEAIRKKIPQYAELSTAVVLSAGVGLAGVLSGFVSDGADFNSFLFGSMVTITEFEARLSVVVGVLVIGVFLFFYRELFYVALDERSARLAGVPVGLTNLVFTLLTAVTVSVAARIIGALVVSSMMVVPVVCAMQVGKSYRQTMAWSVGFSVCFAVAGLLLAYYNNLRSGATIVLTGIVCLLLLLGAGAVLRLVRAAGIKRGVERREKI